MSRTLSKVLIICALVVVLPLMIAGTAMAAYYSINATVSIEVFVEKSIDGASAEVSYKNKSSDKSLKVTDGHLKTASFKTYAVGYDFVGWYAGTYEAYAKELEQGKQIDTVKYAITTPEINVKMTEYQNLVAVFKAKRFNVSYKYFQKPSGLGGVEVNEVPTSKNGIIVDGKPAPETIPNATQTEEFVYGDALHTMEIDGHPEYTFDGWYVGEGDTLYTKATFAETGNIVLTGKWVDSKRINLTYLDHNGNELEKITTESKKPVYANRKYTLKTVEDFATELEAAEFKFENGYTYGWQDVSTGSIVTEIKSETDVVVKVVKSAITYTAKIDVEGSGLKLYDKIAKEITFSKENNDSFDAWQDKNNWIGDHRFWEFAYLTYNNERIENFDTLTDEVIAASPKETTEITLKAVKVSKIDEVKVELSFASKNGIKHDGPVYNGTTLQTKRDAKADNLDVSVGTLFGLVTTDGETTVFDKFYKDNKQEQQVTITSLRFDSLNSSVISFTDDIDLKDLIDKLYELGDKFEDIDISKNITTVGEGAEAKQVLSFSVTVCFD